MAVIMHPWGEEWKATREVLLESTGISVGVRWRWAARLCRAVGAIAVKHNVFWHCNEFTPCACGQPNGSEGASFQFQGSTAAS